MWSVNGSYVTRHINDRTLCRIECLRSTYRQLKRIQCIANDRSLSAYEITKFHFRGRFTVGAACSWSECPKLLMIGQEYQLLDPSCYSLKTEQTVANLGLLYTHIFCLSCHRQHRARGLCFSAELALEHCGVTLPLTLFGYNTGG